MNNLYFSNAPILPTILLVGFFLYFLYGVVKHIQFTRGNVKRSRDLLESVEELEHLKQDENLTQEEKGEITEMQKQLKKSAKIIKNTF